MNKTKPPKYEPDNNIYKQLQQTLFLMVKYFLPPEMSNTKGCLLSTL